LSAPRVSFVQGLVISVVPTNAALEKGGEVVPAPEANNHNDGAFWPAEWKTAWDEMTEALPDLRVRIQDLADQVSQGLSSWVEPWGFGVMTEIPAVQPTPKKRLSSEDKFAAKNAKLEAAAGKAQALQRTPLSPAPPPRKYDNIYMVPAP
jgi:hypothetical protein